VATGDAIGPSIDASLYLAFGTIAPVIC
jgi:hypothetical protein